MEDKDNKIRCHFCGAELIWGGDHDYEDYNIEGSGIVTNLSCSNENCNANWYGYLDCGTKEED